MTRRVGLTVTTVVLAVSALAGCTQTGDAPVPSSPVAPSSAAPGPTATPTGAASGSPTSPAPATSAAAMPRVTPPPVAKGDVSRLVFPARGGAVAMTLQAAVTSKENEVVAACTSRSDIRTVTISLLDASADPPASPEDKVISSFPVTCNGQPTSIGYSGVLPRTTIQLTADTTDGVTSLYAVLRASR